MTALAAVAVGSFAAATPVSAAGLAPSTPPVEGGAYVLADVECDPAQQGVLDLTVVNDDPSAAVQAVVLGAEAVTVAPLSAHAVTLTGLEDGSLSVPLTIDGVDASVTVTVQCDGPVVAVMPATVRSERVGGAPAELPSTGNDVLWGALIGGALVAAGAAASLVARRQHS